MCVYRLCFALAGVPDLSPSQHVQQRLSQSQRWGQENSEGLQDTHVVDYMDLSDTVLSFYCLLDALWSNEF